MSGTDKNGSQQVLAAGFRMLGGMAGGGAGTTKDVFKGTVKLLAGREVFVGYIVEGFGHAQFSYLSL